MSEPPIPEPTDLSPAEPERPAPATLAPRAPAPLRRLPVPAPVRALARQGEPEDHAQFQRSVGLAALGAAGGTLLAYGAAWAASVALWESPLLPMGVMAGALAAVSARPKKWWRAALGGLAGVVGAALYTATEGVWPPFAAALLGLAAAPVLAEGQPLGRKALTAGLAGVAGAAGLFVAQVMLGWDIFEGLVPSLLGSAAAGAAAGLFVGLAGAPKHLGRPLDPVEAQYQPALAVRDGEIHEILQRTIGLHRALKADLTARADDPGVVRVRGREEELVIRILHIAAECRRVQHDLEATPDQEIRARITDLSQRAASAGDPGARSTYQSAVASLEAQLEALTRIDNGRERIVARLHATVALLEKLRFALIHLRSAHAERVGGELSPVTEALEALADEIDATSSAVGEVFGADVALPAGEGAQVVRLPAGRGA